MGPDRWEAEEVDQVCWRDGGRDDTYLVCWEKRSVEIKFYWTPTLEQIQIAAGRKAAILTGVKIA